ncbi:MAG: ribonuclease HII [Patescibacteria group bacterium]
MNPVRNRTRTLGDLARSNTSNTSSAISNGVKYLIGIDEAGRGPLAGPVSVGAVMVPMDFDFTLVEGVKDSKKLSEKKRESLFARFEELRESGQISFVVAFSPASIIDSKGIVFAIRSALAATLEKLGARADECEIRLDGSLKAPEQFTSQQTIVRGDDSEPVISMASIAAKVIRDRHMVQIASQYPAYGFEVHKGYGTASHIKVIGERGLSDLHRTSFCSKLLVGSESV